MKICVAQTRPVTGDIKANIDNHKKLIALAVSHDADIIIFPELSLTGYEPTLAKKLAANPSEARFDEFQTISDDRKITIGVGVPTKSTTGLHISMMIFQPHQPRKVYSKKYLHPDEDEFFVSGLNVTNLKVNNADIALAICYEISIAEHTATVLSMGAKIYIASVAKFARGMEKAKAELSNTAKENKVIVLLSNCVGLCDGNECAGQSAIWNSQGVIVGQLDHLSEGILMIDDGTKEVTQAIL
jgi:predicted amidohydrolase